MTVMTQPQSFTEDLDGHYPLTAEQTRFFREQGYIKLKDVLSPATLEHYGREITSQVFRLNNMTKPMAERTTYEKAFLQIMNLWTQSEVVKEFVFSRKLARLAAELMGVRGVRLYHDQALYKEPSGGITPWHADQYYWPVDTDNTVTAWIPLQHTPQEMGPLAFSATSHRFAVGRNLEISDDSEQKINKALLDQGLPLDDAPFDLGEVSFHYGWTFHRAGPNVSDQPRKVMTVIYMEDGCRIIPPKYKAHENDLKNWMPGLKPGDIAASKLNPLLYRA
jgi:ectoine hydroxylase-related dioxygenase (phytanoyl-CoA dioxygenase family)